MIGRAALIGVAVVAASVAVTLAASAMSGASVPKRAHGTSAVSAARNATRTFHNLQRGENAGYGFFTDKQGIACIAMQGMGGMGVHFVKGALVGDPAERVRQPEALVYRIDANGKLVLVGARVRRAQERVGRKHPIARRCSGTRSTSRRRATDTACPRSTRCTPGSGTPTRPGCSRCGTRG